MVTAAGDQSEPGYEKAGDSCTLTSSKLRLLIQVSDLRLFVSGANMGRRGGVSVLISDGIIKIHWTVQYMNRTGDYSGKETCSGDIREIIFVVSLST